MGFDNSIECYSKKRGECYSTELHWIRGHMRFGGNERVDRISKASVKTTPGGPPFSATSLIAGAPSGARLKNIAGKRNIV